jgi:hypothetical protein
MVLGQQERSHLFGNEVDMKNIKNKVGVWVAFLIFED